jgi:hypothetical protein
MKMKRWLKYGILFGCLAGVVGILLAVWLISPLFFYGYMAFMGAMMVLGAYMNRAYIRMELKRVLEEYREKNSS